MLLAYLCPLTILPNCNGMYLFVSAVRDCVKFIHESGRFDHNETAAHDESL